MPVGPVAVAEPVVASGEVEVKRAAKRVPALGQSVEGGGELGAGGACAIAGEGGASFQIEDDVAERGILAHGLEKSVEGVPPVFGGVERGEGNEGFAVAGVAAGNGLQVRDGLSGTTEAREEARSHEAQGGPALEGGTAFVLREVVEGFADGVESGFGVAGAEGFAGFLQKGVGDAGGGGAFRVGTVGEGHGVKGFGGGVPFAGAHAQGAE